MNSTESMFKQLLSRKVDVALTNPLDGKILNKLGYKNIVPIKEPLARLSLYHYIYKRHEYLVPTINQEIVWLKNNGELARLIKNVENKVMNLNQK